METTGAEDWSAEETVSAIWLDAVKLPEVPVMLMLAVPVAAVLLAVKVKMLEPVVGVVPKLAVTPLGSPEAASVTLPENPPEPITEMVLAPWLPCVMDKLLGEAESV
jgi:hypothetical protein